jgi:hypothetical protein
MKRNPDPERTHFKAWISKYALSKGVFAIDAEDCFDTSPTMIGDMAESLTSYHGEAWHRTQEAALAKAEQMRKARIANLKKQIAKFEKMKFELSSKS